MLIRERVIAGLDHAQRNGTKTGNAVGRPRKVFRRDMVLEMRNAGKSWREIAQAVHAGMTTVRRVVEKGTPDGEKQ